MKNVSALKTTIFQKWDNPLFIIKTPKKKEPRMCTNCNVKPAYGAKRVCVTCYDHKFRTGSLPTTHCPVNSVGV